MYERPIVEYCSVVCMIFYRRNNKQDIITIIETVRKRRFTKTQFSVVQRSSALS